MDELERDIKFIDKCMEELFQVISCNYTHLPMTGVYDRLNQHAARKRLKQFALQLEKTYARTV